MKLIHQTKFGGADHPPEERGDCFAACIAMLIGAELECVPNFCAHDDWAERVQAWLGVRGLSLVIFNNHPFGENALYDDVVVIASGPGPRGHRHCVLWQGRTMFHDPHPSGDGLLGAESYDLIVVIDGERYRNWLVGGRV